MKEALSTCWWRDGSLGDSRTRLVSLHVASFTLRLFKFSWHETNFFFKSYKLAISFLAAFNPALESTSPTFASSVYCSGRFLSNLNTDYFPILNREDVVSQPVHAWATGKIWQAVEDKDRLSSWTGILRMLSFAFVIVPVRNHIWSVDSSLGKKYTERTNICNEQNMCCTELCPCQGSDFCMNPFWRSREKYRESEGDEENDAD
jgi:hypothetical protein